MDITPFIWFEGQAEEAARYYVAIFRDSSIDNVSRYGEGGPGPERSAMMVEFRLNGQEFMALNGGPPENAPAATPTPGSIALFVTCKTQDDVDDVWEKLLSGGRAMQCGWLQDKYGVVWNIVPEGLGELIGSDDRERAQRAMNAMMKMVKLDINELRRAYDA